jgi:hypothetical protein
MDNPFLALFEDAKPRRSDTPEKVEKPPSPKKTDLSSGASRIQRINDIIENAFLFTINPYGLLGVTVIKKNFLFVIDTSTNLCHCL